MRPTIDEKPARPLPDWTYIHRELKRRAVTPLLLWEEYRAEHADGYGYSRFCDLYRLVQNYAWGRRETVLDLAGDIVPVFDAATGIDRRAHIIVTVLGACPLHLCRGALVGRACRLGRGTRQRLQRDRRAIPKAVVCDNLKAGVTATCCYKPGINRTCQELAGHYDIAILPARPRNPRDEAKFEVAVQVVERFALARAPQRALLLAL